MKHALVICDPETEYSRRLMEFINAKKSPVFRAAAFDSFEKAAEAIKRSGADVLLLSEKYVDEKVNELNVKKIIILTEEEDKDFNDLKSIYKYCSGDVILREAESAYDAQLKIMNGPEYRADHGRVYCVYSPVGGSGKTSFALTMGQELAKEQRVLYMNMESCSALDTILGINADWNISDLLYCARQNPKELTERFSEMTFSIQNLDCIMPAASPEDIAGTNAAEWTEIMRRIASESRYDIILTEPSVGIQGFINIMEFSSAVFMPYRGDALSLAKIESYERMLTDCGAEEVIEKTVKVKVPYFNTAGLGRNYYEGLIWSELGDCVRELIRKEKLA